METFQCPECELRFRFPKELEDHIALDHPDFHAEPKSVSAALMAASGRRSHPRHTRDSLRVDARNNS